MKNEHLKSTLLNLPNSPGVYLFKNKSGQIIYIGKAKNLKNRVRHYFQSSNKLDPKTARLVASIDDLELMLTDTEVEALILEANLVKEHKPKYNVNLKDDKHFPYIKVTVNEPFPRVIIVRRLENDGGRYFGPFTSSKGMRRTVHFLTRLFKIRSCNLTIPHPKGKPQKVCLDYHIGRCGGPCENLQTREDYVANVEMVLLFLSGKGGTLINKIKEKMDQLSEAMEFEEAAIMRDRIEALESVRHRQKVDIGQVVNRDIIAFSREGKDTVTVVMQLREGVLIGRQNFQLVSDPDENNEIVLASFIRDYYNHQPNIPEEVYLPCELPDETLLSKWLTGKLRDSVGDKRKTVNLYSPQKGEKLKLVDLAVSNARLLLNELLIQKKGYKERVSKAVQILKEDLGLENSPLKMACVDISNTGETDAVGSLVYFKNGKPYKNGYRRFKIKNVKGQDDFSMMREVVGRYFYRIKEEEKEDNGNTPKNEAPDLLVIDGGKGQLSSVMSEIQSIGFDELNIIGLAKRLEEVYFPYRSEPVTIAKSSPGLGLLKRIRDEAHRFAIEYNRKVRNKRTLQSSLDKLAGVGPVRRNILLRHFGSVKKIKEATLDELMSVKGVPKTVAEKVYKAYH